MQISQCVGALALALLLPAAAPAQQPESEHIFNARMVSRIERIESDVRALQHEIDAGNPAKGDSKPRTRGDNRYGVVRQQLEALEKECNDQSMRLRSGRGPLISSNYDLYRYQQAVQYEVRGLEREVRSIRKYVHEIDADDAKKPNPNAADKKSDSENDEPEISDDEWAEEWARGD